MIPKDLLKSPSLTSLLGDIQSIENQTELDVTYDVVVFTGPPIFTSIYNNALIKNYFKQRRKDQLKNNNNDTNNNNSSSSSSNSNNSNNSNLSLNTPQTAPNENQGFAQKPPR